MEIRPQASAPPCVLLVEDDRDHRTIFRSYLEHRGWRVAEAEQAVSAFERIGDPDIGAVVVDLAGTDGWALLERLGTWPERPPLICLTGDARPASRDRAGRLGVDAYLTKPIRLSELSECLARLRSTPVRPTGPAAARAADGPGTTSEKPLVLLLEDDDDARTIYRDMLGFAGFEVMAACDGIEGLRYAESRRPDVVVTDLHMPGMTGIEVARTLRSAESVPPPLIAVTADSLGLRAAEPRDGSPPLFDEVLIKPVSPGELVRTVLVYLAPRGEAAD